ncbi:BPY2B isoform 3, partial [Pan troglodytes]
MGRMMTLIPEPFHWCYCDIYALLTESIVTYCLTKNLSDVNKSKVGLLTNYLRLYLGEVTPLTRPSMQMRLCCITDSASRPRSQ